MSALATAAAPTGRKKIAQGKERSDAALGNESPNTSSPEGAKEGADLPRGWRWVNLPDIGELSRGKSKHRPRNEPKLYGGPHPFIQTGDIRESGGTIRKHTQTYSELGLAQSKLWPAGTLCITIAANIGETGILSYPACFPDSVVGFRHDGDPVTVRFIELYFRIAKAELERLAPATAQKNINVDILSKLPVPFPPLPEQRRIVAEIEKQFTRLEAGVAALRRVQANLKRYRAAVLKAACEGKLVPTEAELTAKNAKSTKTKPTSLSASSAISAVKALGFETGAELLARILAERRQNWQGRGKYKEPAAPDIANLPEIPDGWTWATTAQLSFLDVGFAFKSAEFEKSGIRLLRGDNLEPGKMRWLDTRYWPESKLDEFRHLLIREGEIILAMDRPLISSGLKIARARADDLPCLLVQRMARFRPVVEGMTSFLFMAMNTHGFIKHLLGGQTGTQLPHISGDGIQSFPVALPPLVEQTRIVAEVERRLSVVEELESVVSANLQRASSLRQSILKKAFTGELV